MKVAFTSIGWEHYEYWADKDKKTHKKIRELIRDARRHPKTGIGKPERLKHGHAGKYSRRINQADRFVYFVDGDTLWVDSLRGHYRG